LGATGTDEHIILAGASDPFYSAECNRVAKAIDGNASSKVDVNTVNAGIKTASCAVSRQEPNRAYYQENWQHRHRGQDSPEMVNSAPKGGGQAGLQLIF